MKKTILFSIATVAIGMFLGSCSKEQSQLTLDSVKGSAVIQGKILYNEGAKLNSESTIVMENIIPAAGQIVLVKVKYSDYGNSSNVGTKIFETTVADDGTYAISIPVAATPVSAEVVLEPFKADHYVMVNGIIQTISNALYNASNTDASITLNERDNKSCNLTVKTEETAASINLTNPITVAGSTNAICEKVTVTNDIYALSPDGTMPISCKAVLQLKNTATVDGKPVDDRIIKHSFDIVDGKYETVGNFYDGWEYNDVEATICIEEFYAKNDDAKNAFTHNYKATANIHYESQKVSGTFGTYPAVDNSTLTEVSKQLKLIYQDGVIPTIDLTLSFKPVNVADGIIGLGNPEFDKDQDGIEKYATMNVMGWETPWN